MSDLHCSCLKVYLFCLQPPPPGGPGGPGGPGQGGPGFDQYGYGGGQQKWVAARVDGPKNISPTYIQLFRTLTMPSQYNKSS